jgi:hypothetical protein
VLRELLGEFTDGPVNYAQSIMKMSNLVYNHAFLSEVRKRGLESGLLSFEESIDRNHHTLLANEANKAYEPLAGLYTSKEFAQGVQDAVVKEDFGNWKYWVVLSGMVRTGLTVGGFPASPMRNFWSGALIALYNGHFDFRKASKFSFATHFKNSEEGMAYMTRLIRLGVLRNGAHARELAELLKETFSAKTLEKGIFSMGSEWLQKVYGFGDDFWKVIGFENEKADLMKYRGMSEAEAEIEAARIIQAKYPSYFNAPRFVTWLRRNIFLAAFPTFTAEIIRNAYNIFGEHANNIKT